MKNMKTLKLVLVLFITGSISTFAQRKDVNTEKSVIEWTGKKITGSHKGNIEIKSGYLELKNGQIKGGEFVVDMATITNTDLEDKEYNQKLVGHLKSDDFFGVEKHPTSTLQLVKVTKFKSGKAAAKGKITIKGKTGYVNFWVLKKGDSYNATIKIDRSKYDVRYGSGSFFDNLGDKTIDDIFILDVKLHL